MAPKTRASTAAVAAPTRSANKSLGHVVVVGGCGFLGYFIVSLVLERYPESKVSALDLRLNLNRIDDPRVSYHSCDITDAVGTQELFAKLRADTVIHVAAVTPDPSIPKTVIHNVNVKGTRNVVDAARETGVKAFVYTSSASVVVGRGWEVINADESWPVLTGSEQPEYYSATKGMAENLVLEANRSSPTFLTAAIRPAGIFGERDHLMLYRTLQITGFKMKFQLGDGNNLFSWTHVKDVAHGHLLAAEALLQTHALGSTLPLDTERVDGEAFFITGGQTYFWDFIRRVWKERDSPDDRSYDVAQVWVLQTSIAYFIATILELVMGLFGKKPNFDTTAVRQSVMTRYFNTEKARNRLNYEPLVTLEDGIRSGVAEVMTRLKPKTG